MSVKKEKKEERNYRGVDNILRDFVADFNNRYGAKTTDLYIFPLYELPSGLISRIDEVEAYLKERGFVIRAATHDSLLLTFSNECLIEIDGDIMFGNVPKKLEYEYNPVKYRSDIFN